MVQMAPYPLAARLPRPLQLLRILVERHLGCTISDLYEPLGRRNDGVSCRTKRPGMNSSHRSTDHCRLDESYAWHPCHAQSHALSLTSTSCRSQAARAVPQGRAPVANDEWRLGARFLARRSPSAEQDRTVRTDRFQPYRALGQTHHPAVWRRHRRALRGRPSSPTATRYLARGTCTADGVRPGPHETGGTSPGCSAQASPP